MGNWQALIVTVEQLSLYKGHLPRLARLLRQDRTFVAKFKFLNVDEAHFIYTAGIRKHGQPPFCPAYGLLDVVRLLFSKQTAVSAHSATLPPHMLKIVTSKLSMPPNRLVINVSSNRPNMVYATRRLVSATSNYHNLDFIIIPIPYHAPMLLQKGVIFLIANRGVRGNDTNGKPPKRRVELVDDTELILDRGFLEPGIHGAANWNEDSIETKIGDGENTEEESSSLGPL